MTTTREMSLLWSTVLRSWTILTFTMLSSKTSWGLSVTSTRYRSWSQTCPKLLKMLQKYTFASCRMARSLLSGGTIRNCCNSCPRSQPRTSTTPSIHLRWRRSGLSFLRETTRRLSWTRTASSRILSTRISLTTSPMKCHRLTILNLLGAS